MRVLSFALFLLHRVLLCRVAGLVVILLLRPAECCDYRYSTVLTLTIDESLEHEVHHGLAREVG